MRTLNLAEVAHFIQENIDLQFHRKKIEKINRLNLNDITKRKNPYLFKTKGLNDAHDFIKSVLEATIISGEETIFGNFLEKIAIFVCEKVYSGRKSGITGIDLEFEDDLKKYLISIKSGPNWGNSGQINNLIKNFNSAKKILTTSGGCVGIDIIFVEACCYGIDNNPVKGTHYKLCGQRFWELISGGNDKLYSDMIEPLGYLSKEYNNEIDLLLSKKLNILTANFIDYFCDDGMINWNKLIKHNSGKN